MTDNIINLCNRIQRRALRSKAAIFSVELIGGTGELHIRARSRDHDYMAPVDEWPPLLMNRYVQLDAPNAVEQLTAALDDMKALGRKQS